MRDSNNHNFKLSIFAKTEKQTKETSGATSDVNINVQLHNLDAENYSKDIDMRSGVTKIENQSDLPLLKQKKEYNSITLGTNQFAEYSFDNQIGHTKIRNALLDEDERRNLPPEI